MELLKEITEYLFDGAVDYREVVSKMSPDASDVHVPSAQAKKDQRRKQIINRTGQGLNALAIGAGTHALVMAGRDERLKGPGAKDAKKGKISFARVASAPYRSYEKTKLASKIGTKSKFAGKYALPLAGGALALHSAEIVGDSIAARALHSQGKELKKKPDEHIKKMLQARREGVLTTEQVIELTKALDHQIKMDEVASKATKQGKKTILIGTGLLAAGAGAYSMKRAKETDINPKIKPSVSMQPVKKPKEDVGKSDDLIWEGTVSKVDDEKRQVFGWCSLTKVNGEEVVDRQGDYIPLEEVEKSAYDYVIHSRKGGDMHKRDGETPLHTSDMIESFVVTPEKLEKLGLEPDAMPHGWWVGFKVNDDEQWESVKKGERNHFSIHGKGKRRERAAA